MGMLLQFGMLSPTGRCRMWDAAADGYARGEGFAVVVIKTLKQAIADNDDIECVIRNTGVNQDGRSTGLTVPSADAQEALIRSTYASCGLDCRKKEDRCQYFEAHGTGQLFFLPSVVFYRVQCLRRPKLGIYSGHEKALAEG